MPKLILDGDARGAVKATTDLTKAATAYGSEVKKNAAVNRQAAAEQRQAQKEEQRRLERATTAWRQHNQLIARVLDSEKQKWNEVIAAGERHRYGLVQVTRATESVNTAQSKMGAFLMRWAGPAALFAGAVQGLRTYVAEIDAVIEKVKNQSGGLAVLSQFAINRGNPEAAFAQYVSEARAAVKVGAVPSGDLGEAGSLIAALVGASLNERDRSYLVGLQGRQVVENVGKLAPSIAAFQASFPQLTAQQIVGKGLATAEVGSSRIDELIKEVGVAAPAARQLGFGPDFILAAGSVLDRAMASASEGATRLESFMRQFERFGLQNFPELAGQDPLSVLRTIQGAGTDRPTLEKFVGNRAEAIQGVRLLMQNLPEVERLMAAAGAADKNRLAQRFADLPGTVPFLAAGEAGRRAAGQRLESTLDLTTLPGLVQAVQDSVIAQRRATEPGMLGEARNLFNSFASFLAPLLPQQMLEAELRTRLRQGISDPVLRSQVESALTPAANDMDRAAAAIDARRQTRALESIDRKTRSVPVPAGRQE